MFGVRGGNVSIALVGWLWADILLGLFVLFLAASNGAPSPVAAAEPRAAEARTGVDPRPLVLTLRVDGRRLLGNDAAALRAEQARIWDEVQQAVGPGNRVAMVLAYAAHESPTEGDRLARIVMAPFRTGAFEGAVLKGFHELTPGDRGSTVQLEIYIYE